MSRQTAIHSWKATFGGLKVFRFFVSPYFTGSPSPWNVPNIRSQMIKMPP
jgi:hypothetical protein